MMKNARLPKIGILLQFGGKILALLCSDDSKHTLLKFQKFGTEEKSEGFVWSRQSKTCQYPTPKLNYM